MCRGNEQAPITNCTPTRPICWEDTGNVPVPIFSISLTEICCLFRVEECERWGVGPAVLGRKFSGQSMWRIRPGFGAQRPGSEQYSQWGPWESWRGRLEGREGEGQGRGERRLTWNCQEDGSVGQAGNRRAVRVLVDIMNGTDTLPPTQINTLFLVRLDNLRREGKI